MSVRTRLFSSHVAPVVFALALVTSASADHHEKTIDPSGTWRWEHEHAGETVKDVLKLDLKKKGEVVGTYQGSGDPIEIEKGKMEEDKLSFQFDVEFGGQSVTVLFAGKIKEDDVNGQVTFKNETDEYTFDWSAERSVHASDVVGLWKIEITTPDGNVLEPEVKITGENDKLKGQYSAFGQEVEVGKIAVKENQLLFTVELDLNGTPLTANYKGRPYGNKLNGTIDYDINGNTGEVDFTGKRAAAKKETKKSKPAAKSE